MQKKSYKVSRELAKYFATYLLVLFPILIVTFLMGSRVFSALKQETLTSIQVGVHRVSSEFTELFDRIQRTAISLSSNVDHNYKHISPDKKETIDAIATLRMVSSMDAGIDSLALIYTAHNVVYSSSGKENLDVYMKSGAGLESESQQVYSGILESGLSTTTLLSNVAGKDVLLFHYVHETNRDMGEVPYVSIIMDFSKIEEQFSNVLGLCPGYIFLEFENNQHAAMYYDGKGTFERVDFDKAMRTCGQSDFQRLYEEKITSEIYLQVDCQTGYMYRRVSNLQTIYLLSIVVGLLITTVLCYRLSEKRYRYLEKLYHTVSNRLPNQVDEHAVFNAVSTVVEQRENVRRKSEAMQRLLDQQNGVLLFHGLIYDQETIGHLLLDSGVSDLSQIHFSVVGMLLSKGEYHITPILSTVGCKLYYEMKISNNQALFVLIPLPKFGEHHSIQHEIGQRLSALLRQFGEERIIIAFSRLFSEASMSGNALIEVSATLEYLRSKSKNEQIAFGEDIMPTISSMKHLPEENIRALQKLLRDKDEKSAMVQVRILCDQIDSQPISLLVKRYLRYEIIYAIMKEIRANERDHEALLMDAVEINTDDEQFEKQVQQIIAKFCRKRERKQFDFCEVLNYIDTHYMDSNLSQKQIADHFQMNRSYLSTLFKAKMSFGYMEYLTELRLKNAVELLKSGVPVQEVASRVGYADENTFRKRFRERFGYNPTNISGEVSD